MADSQEEMSFWRNFLEEDFTLEQQLVKLKMRKCGQIENRQACSTISSRSSIYSASSSSLNIL